MTAPVDCRYYGRDFTTAEMALLCALIAGPPTLNRHALSKEFCRRIGWYKADGGVKDMMARVVMLAMHRAAGSNCPAEVVPEPDQADHVRAPTANRPDCRRRPQRSPHFVTF